ncbi:DUF1320 domain-containing protein [Sagittula sp. NFXS13]|uniref:gp436 family protein n=1 Tax=Sagittula sp. NFXS13 TaxID=2819095 RepID=UPI0032DF9EF0
MSYCTLSDLDARYGTALLVDLTDRAEEATGVIDAVAVAQAIADADAMIDGYVAGRYALPFATVPDPIPALSRAIAIYTLHVYQPNEKIEADYRDAIDTLKGIARGSIKLNAAGVAPKTSGGHGARVTDRDRDFTAKTMKGFI